MINRVLIRIRVLQLAYEYYHGGENKLNAILKQLDNSLKRTYDLYLFLLLLIVELTELHKKQLEINKRKHLATAEDRNPNMKLANNKVAILLEQDEFLQDWADENKLRWSQIDFSLRPLHRKLLNSEAYNNYIKNEKGEGIAQDRSFWVNAMREVILTDSSVADILEAECPFWDNQLFIEEKIEVEEAPDIENVEQVVSEAMGTEHYKTDNPKDLPYAIVSEFVLKSIKKISSKSELMPMYKDEEDEQMARKLLELALSNGDLYRKLIEDNLINWEAERIADMDMLIMQLAVTELIHFPDIPAAVSVNEYIDLAKLFSTNKSGTFVNGLLDSIVRKLRETGKIEK